MFANSHYFDYDVHYDLLDSAARVHS